MGYILGGKFDNFEQACIEAELKNQKNCAKEYETKFNNLQENYDKDMAIHQMEAKLFQNQIKDLQEKYEKESEDLKLAESLKEMYKTQLKNVEAELKKCQDDFKGNIFVEATLLLEVLGPGSLVLGSLVQTPRTVEFVDAEG